MRESTSDAGPAGGGRVEVEGAVVTIHHLRVEDAVLADLLAAQPVESRAAVVERALAVGGRGLATMGLGLDLEHLDARVRTVLEDVLTGAGAGALQAIETAAAAMQGHLDPDDRASLVSSALDRLGGLKDDMLQRLDPDQAGTHTAKFIAEIERLIGPGGVLQQRLTEALDPDADGSALAGLRRTIELRFAELTALVGREQGRAAEAEAGTRKGRDFEDVVEDSLRGLARSLGGCTVERTTSLPGKLGARAIVGDFVVTLPGGYRIVVEAKNTVDQGLRGKNGILAELDRARENREADYAVCVSRDDAFPAEVGVFGVFGDRVLVVDDGSGVLLEAALRWAQAAVSAAACSQRDRVDLELVAGRLARLRSLATRFSGAKQALTGAQSSLEMVKDELASMRAELLDLVDDAARELAGAGSGDGPGLAVA